MTRVVLYVPDLSAGGAERVALNLLEALPTSELEVTLLLNRLSGPLLPALPPTARVVSLKARRTAAAIWPLVKFLRREKPDVLIAFLSFNNIVAVWANRLAGGRTRIIATVHSPLSNETDAHKSLNFRVVPPLYSATLRFAAAVVSVSHGVGEDLKRFLPARTPITVIHNPIVTPRLLALAEEAVEHPWFAPGEDPVVLGVGRLVDQKNPQLLIEAFARLPRTVRARLVLIGDGPLRADLEALIARLGLQGRAMLLGSDPNPWRYMARARVLTLTSRYEGFGNVLVEALATGLPVISVDCEYGPAEILEGGKWGRLVSPPDAAAIADAIAAELQGVPDRAALRGRANDFSAASVAQRYRTLVAQVT